MPTIPYIDKSKVMRPALIDAADTINALIDAVDALDPSSLTARVTALESASTATNTRIDNLSATVTTIDGDVTAHDADITTIKATLYTPLNQNV